MWLIRVAICLRALRVMWFSVHSEADDDNDAYGVVLKRCAKSVEELNFSSAKFSK